MIIAVFNPKDGVGKTTTAVATASVLARAGHSVLLIDLEADLNASIALGAGAAHSVLVIDHDAPESPSLAFGAGPPVTTPPLAALLLPPYPPQAAVHEVEGIGGLHLIKGSRMLTSIDHALRNVRQPDRRLH